MTRILGAISGLTIALSAVTGASFAEETDAGVKPTLTEDVATLLTVERKAMSSVVTDPVLKKTGVSALKPKPKPKGLIASKIPSRKELRAKPFTKGGSEWACLTEALYFEARGESISGIFAVAEVIVNRKKSAYFPGSICAVISQGAHRRNACQFSYKCDGQAEVYHEQKAYHMVGKIAKMVLNGETRTLTNGATFYHSTAVSPRWSRAFARTTQIGKHLFYRRPS